MPLSFPYDWGINIGSPLPVLLPPLPEWARLIINPDGELYLYPAPNYDGAVPGDLSGN